jgi:hypothetical protein
MKCPFDAFSFFALHNEAMKKLFVYYSLSGNGEALAKLFAERGYTLLKLETMKPIGKMNFFKMVHYGGKATFHKKAKLQPYLFNEEGDMKLVICSPVWADRFATPLNTFLADHPLKNPHPIFIFNSMSGSCKKGKAEILKRYPNATCYDIKNASQNGEEAKRLADLLS